MALAAFVPPLAPAAAGEILGTSPPNLAGTGGLPGGGVDVPGTGDGVPRGDVNTAGAHPQRLGGGVVGVRLVRLVGWLVDPRVELLIRDDGRRHHLELRWLDRERLERRVPASLAAQRLRAAARFKRPQGGAGGAGGAPALQGGDGRGLVLELLG